jgi:hypothetical protein
MTSKADGKTPGADTLFCYADVALVGIDEDLDIGVFFAGGLRGAYKQILSKRIKVTRGGMTYGVPITATTNIVAYKSQTRQLRTQDARRLPDSDETGSCPAERGITEDRDESFQLAIVGQGPATLRWVRAWSAPVREDLSGDGEACQDETRFNAVRFDGVGASSEDLATAKEAVLATAVQRFTSNQTETVTQDGQSAVGVGYAESVISQRAADRVAGRVATRAAESELSRTLPPIISAGDTLSA